MWFFRVVEEAEQGWACHRGLEVIDTHTSLEEAVTHLRSIAEQHRPSQLFVHRLDGTAENLGIITEWRTATEVNRSGESGDFLA